MNDLLVMKFGGTSVSDVPRLRAVGALTRQAIAEGRPVVVVCSALAGVTNSLIALARSAAAGQNEHVEQLRRDFWSRHRQLADGLLQDQWEREALIEDWAEQLKTIDRLQRSLATLGELSARALDAMAAYGERWSVRLVAAMLREAGVPARAFDTTELVVTDDTFGAARPLMGPTAAHLRERVEPLLATGMVAVMTGYIGATADGVPTTLGRGGSDFSAAIIGAALGAQEVQIWTDVNGILTADPKLVPGARTLGELSYLEAAEIATFGAEVLHPRTIAPLAERGIALSIRNTFQPTHEGTRIVAEPRPSAHQVRAIISTRELALLTLRGGAGWTPDLAARALKTLAESGVEVLMLTQSFSERSLTLVTRQGDQPLAEQLLNIAFAGERERGEMQPVTVQQPVATISVVGNPSVEGGTLVASTFSALGKTGSRVLALAQSAAAYHVSFVLPDEDVARTVLALHGALGLERPG